MAENRAATGGWQRDPHDLDGGGYERVALALMRAIARDERTTLILNVPGGGAAAFLDCRRRSSKCRARWARSGPARCRWRRRTSTRPG